MSVELLLLLLAWAGTVSLLVVLPWAVIRLIVRVLEANVSKPGAGHEHEQPHQYSDTAATTAPSREPDAAGGSDGAAASPAAPGGGDDR